MNPEEKTSPIESHPMKTKLKENGITSEKLIDTALLVYLNLIEVNHWFDVETIVLREKQIVFIEGRRNNKKTEEYVLPISSKEELTMKKMAEFLQLASQIGSPNRLTLAIVYTSSTILMYEICNGLVEPKPPTNKEIERMESVPYWNEQQGKWKF